MLKKSINIYINILNLLDMDIIEKNEFFNYIKVNDFYKN